MILTVQTNIYHFLASPAGWRAVAWNLKANFTGFSFYIELEQGTIISSQYMYLWRNSKVGCFALLKTLLIIRWAIIVYRIVSPDEIKRAINITSLYSTDSLPIAYCDRKAFDCRAYSCSRHTHKPNPQTMLSIRHVSKCKTNLVQGRNDYAYNYLWFNSIGRC